MAIRVVDDDMNFVALLAFLLGDAGYQTLRAYDGPAALQSVKQHHPELVLLDIGLPQMSGFDVCRAIRRFSDVPIIFLSARSGAQDRVTGLQLGADDYLVKPCDPTELLARIAAILRRRSASQDPRAGPLRAGDLLLDPITYTVAMRGAHPILLTPIEWRLLHYLVQHTGYTVSTHQILHDVWGANKVRQANVAVYIRRLRLKLEAAGAQTRCLVTVPPVGYRFVH